MGIREIIVPVRGDGKGETLLSNAINLAQRFSAHIEVVHCRPQPQDLLSFDIRIPAGLRSQIEQSASGAADADEAYLRGLFDQYASRHGLELCETRPWPDDRPTARWSEEVGKQPEIIEKVGHFVDMLVLARPDRKSGLGFKTLEAALIHSGRPVMLAPPHEVKQTIGRHILIGWYGATETARALSMLMPVLHQTDQITLLEVTGSGKDATTVDAAANHLKEHRLNAVPMRKQASGRIKVAQCLLDTANEVGADSLLIGAFGHSRRLEFVMGGVTQHIIENAGLPVFMTH